MAGRVYGRRGVIIRRRGRFEGGQAFLPFGITRPDWSCDSAATKCLLDNEFEGASLFVAGISGDRPDARVTIVGNGA